MSYHIPIMLHEVIEYLNIKPDGMYMDCTTGGGGHSIEIAKRIPQGRLICLDQDEEALAYAKNRLQPYLSRVDFFHTNFCDFKSVLNRLDITSLDGILLDIGVSSHQIDDKERGFSYMQDAVLDMRMDISKSLTAREIISTYSEEQLSDIFWIYGEEKFSKKIANKIVRERENKEIVSTLELVKIIEDAVPYVYKRNKTGHIAKKVFQALRLEVNNEINVLENALPQMIDALRKNGRMVVLDFHSLEDRIIKNAFKLKAQGCICPPEVPICTCHKQSEIRILTKKPVTPSIEELEKNSRSISCKLRAIEKIV